MKKLLLTTVIATLALTSTAHAQNYSADSVDLPVMHASVKTVALKSYQPYYRSGKPLPVYGSQVYIPADYEPKQSIDWNRWGLRTSDYQDYVDPDDLAKNPTKISLSRAIINAESDRVAELSDYDMHWYKASIRNIHERSDSSLVFENEKHKNTDLLFPGRVRLTESFPRN